MVVIAEEEESDVASLESLSGTLKTLDATLFVVGVGSDMDDPSVKTIASKEDYAYHVTSLNDIMSVTTNLSDQICDLKGIYLQFVSSIYYLYDNLSIYASAILAKCP